MVEVEVDGEWHPGFARRRTTHGGGRIEYQVQCHPNGEGNRLEVFPSERVRLDAVGRSYGRE